MLHKALSLRLRWWIISINFQTISAKFYCYKWITGVIKQKAAHQLEEAKNRRRKNHLEIYFTRRNQLLKTLKFLLKTSLWGSRLTEEKFNYSLNRNFESSFQFSFSATAKPLNDSLERQYFSSPSSSSPFFWSLPFGNLRKLWHGMWSTDT